MAVADDLLQRHADVWQGATRHPFLEAIRGGTVPLAAFNAWLEQDYLFVADLLRFQARLLARAPRYAQAVLAGGLVALESELGWFEAQAAARGLRLEVAPRPATAAYAQALARRDAGAFAPALVALWALERVYLEAWQSARPGAEQYRPFVEHWTVPAFAEYVAGLQATVERALAEATALAADGEAAFVEVARLERAFWDMAWQAPDAPATAPAAPATAPAAPAKAAGGRTASARAVGGGAAQEGRH